MVDTYTYAYPQLVRDNPRSFATVTDPNVRVAVIGAGFAGAAAVYELRRAGIQNITVYEAREKLGGRADSRYFHDNQGRRYINEMGPMRVPENSKLFWHYLSQLQDADEPQLIFPNPGVVATQIVYRGLRYTWKDEAPQPTDPENPRHVDWEKLQQDIGRFVDSLTFNGDNVGTIAELLQKETLTLIEQGRIHAYWSHFLKQFDDVSFVGALEQFFGDEWGPTEYNMFSTLGVGTGGFGPLFPVCFLELFRLFLWDYQNEYMPSLPMAEIVERLLTLDPAAGQSDDRLSILTETVDYVGLSRHNDNEVDVYSIQPQGETNGLVHRAYDYVIVATPLRSMQIRMNLDAETPPRSYAENSAPVFGGEVNNMVRESLRIPHIMNSSKLFGFLPNKPWNESSWPHHEGDPVKVVLTDTLARQMYFLDPYPDDPTAGTNVLISYNWGDDSVKIMGIQDYDRSQIIDPRSNPDYALKLAYEFGLETMITPSPVADSLKQITLENQNRDLTSVIWQREPMIFGAFKLDYPKQYFYTSQMVYQYHYANAEHPEQSKRVYIAGNNCSYQGGWIEGALQSAVNASAAVLKHLSDQGLATDFRMQELFEPNPFQNVLEDLKAQYILPTAA
ncbi:flavin monoamine oxidase family protein [Candidatus Entotheonella palauensis]|uniref:Amine oxidase domain-containing protein n=1 Tax=Candidatus Entotheonella gemina TaxID=1429439 RepID=W4LKI4_9BACT|nr:FAD-dependent oxidoreductase [Candidatus Entotheonella palauensis]ETW98613.1 MAG: hypothetical protein ETSY2_42545 [Candidatus Entotheonella gemina]